MQTLQNIPKDEVLAIVREALRDDVNTIGIAKQSSDTYTVTWSDAKLTSIRKKIIQEATSTKE